MQTTPFHLPTPPAFGYLLHSSDKGGGRPSECQARWRTKIAGGFPCVAAPRAQLRAALILLGALLFGIPPAHAQVTYRIVAQTGQPAPGTEPGVTFSPLAFFNKVAGPVISANGKVAFVGVVTGPGIVGDNATAIWAGTPGSLQLLARGGGPAPDPTNANLTFIDFGQLGTPQVLRTPLVINDAAEVAFRWIVTGPGVTAANRTAIWAGSSGALKQILRDGSPAVGFPDGVTILGFPSLAPSFNPSGIIALQAVLKGTGIGPTNNAAIWVGAPGSLQLALQSGSPATAAGAGRYFRGFGVPRVNDAGQMVFDGFLVGRSVNEPTIWVGRPGSFQLLAQTDSAAPGTPEGVTFLDFGPRHSLNAAGKVAFLGRLVGGDVTPVNNQGIWVGSPGAIQLVARTGTPAPGTEEGVVFADFGLLLRTPVPLLDGAGQVGFRATLSGPGVDDSNDEGFWSGTPGSVKLIARKGMVAPGTQKLFASLDSDLSMNSMGQVAFLASLRTIESPSPFGPFLWGGSPGSLEPLFAEDQAVDLGNGKSGILRSQFAFPFNGTAAGGEASIISDSGEVVFVGSISNPNTGVIDEAIMIASLSSSASASLRIDSIERAGDDIRLTFKSIAGKSYKMEARQDVTGDTWVALPASIQGNGQTIVSTHKDAAKSVQQFYRIREE